MIELIAGQALYLPAGTFHEVRNFSYGILSDRSALFISLPMPSMQPTICGKPFCSLLSCDVGRSILDCDVLRCWSVTVQVTSFSNTAEGTPGGHLAVSWWFMPPDNLGAKDHHQPYISGFWPAFWQTRLPQLQRLAWRQVPEGETVAEVLINSDLDTGILEDLESRSQTNSERTSVRGRRISSRLPIQNSRRRHHCSLIRKFQRPLPSCNI